MQQMLMLIPAFGVDSSSSCAETGKHFQTQRLTSAWCRWCGRHYCAELMRVSEVSRLPFLGYEVGLRNR